MILLKREVVEDPNISLIVVDTRAFRIYPTSNAIVTKDNAAITLKLKKRSEEISPKDLEEFTKVSYSRIPASKIIPFLTKIERLVQQHPVFYFVGSVKRPMFWALKYLNFWRINETEFSIRTTEYDEIDWRQCTEKNLRLDMNYVHEEKK